MAKKDLTPKIVIRHRPPDHLSACVTHRFSSWWDFFFLQLTVALRIKKDRWMWRRTHEGFAPRGPMSAETHIKVELRQSLYFSSNSSKKAALRMSFISWNGHLEVLKWPSFLSRWLSSTNSIWRGQVWADASMVSPIANDRRFRYE